MQVLLPIFISSCAYFLGSIPFGLIIVQASTGQDIRQVAKRLVKGNERLVSFRSRKRKNKE